MADQTVKITNLPDSGSTTRVAYDLYLQNRVTLPKPAGDGLAQIKQHLALYRACLQATNGARPDFEGLS